MQEITSIQERLIKLGNSQLPKLLKDKIILLSKELSDNKEYAGDDLINVGEAILKQLAAVGFANYISQDKQSKSLNERLLSHFQSSEEDIAKTNASVYFNDAKRMLGMSDNLALKKHFEVEINIGGDLPKKTPSDFDQLRNELMHGFFIFPISRILNEIQYIIFFLDYCIKNKVFEHPFKFHFIDENGFTGRWNVSNHWGLYTNLKNDFGDLTAIVSHQKSEAFLGEQEKLINDNVNSDTSEIEEFLKNKEKIKDYFSHIFWHKPSATKLALDNYKYLVKSLIESDNYFPIYYHIDGTGRSFTADFMENYILRKMNKEFKGFVKAKNNKSEEGFLENIKEYFNDKNFLTDAPKRKPPILILSGVHQALFSPAHLFLGLDTLKGNKGFSIPIICFSERYSYLESFFQTSSLLTTDLVIPTWEELEKSMINYLRFKGPFLDIEEEKVSYETLKSTLEAILKRLGEGKEIIARLYAEEIDVPIEYVHECMDILYAYLDKDKLDKRNFEEDVLHPIYEYSEEIKESSRIYLSLGRRDIKLEYKHRIINISK